MKREAIIGRAFTLLCLILPLIAAADTVKIGDGETGRPLNTTNGVPTQPGTLLPAEIVGINRYGVVNHGDCTVYTAAGTTTGVKIGAGNLASIYFMSGTAVSVIVYDNPTAASGTKRYDNSAIGVTPTTGFLPPPIPIGAALSAGASVVVAGTNPVVGICIL